MIFDFFSYLLSSYNKPIPQIYRGRFIHFKWYRGIISLEVLSPIFIPYTVYMLLIYCQDFPNTYNRVHRNVLKGTANSPCKLLCMCCHTSLSSLLKKLAPLAPHFKCLHKCCTCPVSFQQGIFRTLMLITRGCMVWWFGIQPLAFLPSTRKEVIP